MKLKYFVDGLPFCWLALLLAVQSLDPPCAAGQNFAAPQTEQTEPEPPPANPQMAHIRTWFMATPSQPVDVVLKLGDSPADPLVSKPYPYFYCGYRESAPGTGRILIQTRTEPPLVLASEDAKLTAKRFYTVLIRSRNDRYDVQLLDDTLRQDPSAANESAPPILHRVKLYQFLDNQPVDLDIEALGFAEQLKPGEARDLEVTEPVPLLIRFRIKDPSGQEISGETDANLSEIPSISVLILRDLYGRFSPRVIANGILD